MAKANYEIVDFIFILMYSFQTYYFNPNACLRYYGLNFYGIVEIAISLIPGMVLHKNVLLW